MPETFGENKDEQFEDIPRADVLVVLSHGLRKERSGHVGLDLESKMRTMGAFELWNRGYAKKVLFVGGKADDFPDEVLSEKMKEYLVECGVPSNEILTEGESQNTSENLDRVLDMLEKDPEVRHILIETNEYHLDRAAQLFGNILRKHKLALQDAGFISAETLLNMRSPHYKQLLTKYYTFPDALTAAPADAIKKGLREFLRRVLIYVDPQDRIARFLVQNVKSPAIRKILRPQ